MKLIKTIDGYNYGDWTITSNGGFSTIKTWTACNQKENIWFWKFTRKELLEVINNDSYYQLEDLYKKSLY